MYTAKGTEDGHKLFFRILFDEEATLIYPRDNMLRVSDGQWSTDKVIRVIENGTSDFNEAIGQRVIGSTSGASALIATVIKFREGIDLIAEINLDEDSVEGEFTVGEIVTTTDIGKDLEISIVVKGIVTGATVTSGGAYYNTNDAVSIAVVVMMRQQVLLNQQDKVTLMRLLLRMVVVDILSVKNSDLL